MVIGSIFTQQILDKYEWAEFNSNQKTKAVWLIESIKNILIFKPNNIWACFSQIISI